MEQLAGSASACSRRDVNQHRLTSRQERAKGMFGKREYKTAERYYGEAIAMCPDARLYSNRAACRLAQVCVCDSLPNPIR